MKTFLIPMIVITLGHFFLDFYMNLLPGLMPSIAANLGLSMTLSGLLFTIQSMASSWLQPIFGYFGYKFKLSRILAFSLILTAFFMSMLGIAGNFIFLLFVVVLGSISSAIFHPFGSVAMTAVYRKNQGFIMSIYFAAGTLGMTVAPILSTLVKQKIGLNGILFLAAPGIIIGLVILLLRSHYYQTSGYEIIKSGGKQTNFVRIIVILVMLVGLRAWVTNTFTMYIPTYYVMKGLTEEAAGGIQAAFLLCTSIGGIAGGIATDRTGVKKMFIFSGFLATVSLIAFFYTSGVFAVVMLLLCGTLLQAAYPGMVVLAQKMFSNNQSVATGFLQGFGFGIGGLGCLITGALYDFFGANLHFALFNNVIILSVSLIVTIFFFPQDSGDVKKSRHISV
ncbi:MAG: MFS transporter [Tepidanaerobacteraceae bacterium]|jgi:FSR family fosmidomycin resistance protein-like MFS transporter